MHQELPAQHYVAAEARLTDAALRLPRDNSPDNSPEEASAGWLGLQGLHSADSKCPMVDPSVVDVFAA